MESGSSPSPIVGIRQDINLTQSVGSVQTSSELDTYNIARLTAELEQMRQNTQERKKYAQRIFWMVSTWLIVILLMIVAVGIGWLTLSDAVVLGLIGSTTINVTAFFLSVTKYLFPNQPGG